MASTIELKLTLEFSENGAEQHEGDIRRNVLQALVNHVENSEAGIAGNNFDAFAGKIIIESINTSLVNKNQNLWSYHSGIDGE